MATQITDVVKHFIQEQGISEERALHLVEDTLLQAYKRQYGNADNAVIRFGDDNEEVSILAKKTVVDGVYDPITEIDLEEARSYNPEAELGDDLLLEVDPKEFDRISVQSAKQTARQSIRETKKDTLYSEFKDKVGEIIIGYYQRERNGDIFVDLGKAEGKLPRRFQSPQEEYHAGDRIKAYIAEVNKTPKGLDIVLSRTHAEFVRAIFELEVPEIYDRVVEIHKIVREPGYRTKLAVYSNDKNVDPVGACVGLKGVRIQAVTQELEGEKVDVLKYEVDPRMFIKNALSPAKVKEVIIKDEAKHQALAVVEESSLSLAIGKNGLNVRLANRLVDWMIDVRTESQYKTSDVESDSRRAISKLFREGEDYEEEYSRISDLPGVDEGLLALLSGNGIEEIVDFLEKTTEDLLAIPGISGEQIEALRSLIDTYVEVVEEEEVEAEAETEELEAEAELAADTGKVEDAVAEETAEAPIPAEIEEEDLDEEYECPECGETITEEMTKCPKCGVGLSFEEED